MKFWKRKKTELKSTRSIGKEAFHEVIAGEMLNRPMLRNNIWLILLVVAFVVVYVAVRYQCQRDILEINKLESQLQDAKYQALASSSLLTERSRETYITDRLKHSKDSTLAPSDFPPFLIEVPTKE